MFKQIIQLINRWKNKIAFKKYLKQIKNNDKSSKNGNG
jgi:hypothetical protein